MKHEVVATVGFEGFQNQGVGRSARSQPSLYQMPSRDGAQQQHRAGLGSRVSYMSPCGMTDPPLLLLSLVQCPCPLCLSKSPALLCLQEYHPSYQVICLGSPSRRVYRNWGSGEAYRTLSINHMWTKEL